MLNLSSIDLGCPLYKVAVNPASDQLVVISTRDGEFSVYKWDTSYRLDLSAKFGWNGEGLRVQCALDPNNLIEWRDDQLVNRTVDVAFHPSGQYFACVGPNHPIQLRAAADCTILKSIGEPGQHSSVIFSASGNSLVAGGWVVKHGSDHFNRSAIYDTMTGLRTATFWSSTQAYARHPRGDILANAINKQGASRIRFMHVNGQFTGFDTVFQTALRIEGIAFSPDGRFLAMIGEEDYFSIRVHCFPSFNCGFRKLYELPSTYRRQFNSPKQLVFSHDSQYLICPWPTGHIVEFETASGSEVRRWQGHAGMVHSLDISYDKQILISGGEDGKVVLWKLECPPVLSTVAGIEEAARFLQTANAIDAADVGANSRVIEDSKFEFVLTDIE